MRKHTFAFIPFFFLSLFCFERGLAQDEVLEVKWNPPKVYPTKKKKRRKVILSGKTRPNARILLPQRSVSIIRPKGVEKGEKYYEKDPVSQQLYIIVGPSGKFKLRLRLSSRYKNLPIQVHSISLNQRHDYLLDIKKAEVKLGVKEDGDEFGKKKKKKKRLKFWSRKKRNALWLGTGLNFVKFDQKSNLSDFSFSSFKAPSMLLKYERRLFKQWELKTFAKVSPGEILSSDSIQAVQSNYNWNIFGLEGVYYPKSFSFKLFKTRIKGAIRSGLQHHQAPFLIRKTLDGSSIDVTANEISMFFIGAEIFTSKFYPWLYEVFLRYQQPVASGASVTVTPKLAFDGSLGAIRRINKTWQWGIFWYGQLLNYQFDTTDSLDTTPISGEHSLLFSNIEVRLGYSF